ncbi:MAG: helix-turn-helix domain-containing protein [Polyangiaceae bacterium]
MRGKPRRSYVSEQREKSAASTRKRVLRAASALFARRGIDAVTIAEIAERAAVGGSTVYAIYGSKEGVLRALLETTLFGKAYRSAVIRLDGVEDPVERLAMTATIARAIYESESKEITLIRGAAAFSSALRRLEQGLEERRYELQEERVKALHTAKLLRKGLTLPKARRLVWMYTARDVYRLLVLEGGWSNDEYEAWLRETLVTALVRSVR